MFDALIAYRRVVRRLNQCSEILTSFESTKNNNKYPVIVMSYFFTTKLTTFIFIKFASLFDHVTETVGYFTYKIYTLFDHANDRTELCLGVALIN